MRLSGVQYKLRPGHIRSVAVVGAGPYGAGVTKALVKEGSFDQIHVFERREQFGGLWNYTKPLLKHHGVTCAAAVPCENARLQMRPQLTKDGRPAFQTAAYRYLDTNVPRDLMQYRSISFPEGTPLFPTREQVLEHILQFCRPIKKYVQFNTEVTKVSYDDARAKYSVLTTNLLDNTTRAIEVDAVAVATGYYNMPFIPDRPGLKSWHETYPCSISHSIDFDAPEDFLDVKGEIIVVGNNASGSDISYELARCLKRPIYKSKRSESLLPGGSDSNIKDVADIKRLDPASKTVELVDGQVIQNVEKLLFCTGYLKSVPFLPSSAKEGEHGNRVMSQLITEGDKVTDLYNHMLSIRLPTLAFLGLPRYVLPIRLSETQGSWLARVWSGRISLPSEEVQWKYHEWTLENNGRGIKYHDLLFPHDIQHSQRLNMEIRHAGAGGHFGVEWTGNHIKLRAALKPLKEAYIEYLKQTNKRAVSVEELIDNGYFTWPEDATTCVQVPHFAP
ncbi:AGR055Cp [Eremothecium gossypii ATCC 10895]|uniref:AGR055Cp n=1 Tax=Eremothecium gossypii (strain ATCC 10895 / CBS 109.51 / FGSC 9923 / NRRL Y-1056) TaxID=284811 RepID=Q750A2_EREGS|nr:AGR055Cp [Eremothecium gossypii ATCC 10895]AAS54544.1 AGR055Cp [Eremothecium gossypii ATCC 10895]AEY98876.1 FAGR055Cp [Eremothecium gossypii FDAG1]